MKTCMKCNGGMSLLQYRDLDNEDHCREVKHKLLVNYLCQKCCTENKEEFGHCEDCGDSIVYDTFHLKSVMYEQGLYCPVHASKYNETGNTDNDDDDDGIQDYIEYNTKDN